MPPLTPPLEDIRDLKGWMAIGGIPWYWVVAASLLALLAAAYLWRRRRKPDAVVPPAPEPKGPTGEERLSALRSWSDWDAEGIRRFYFRMSEALRAALEEAFPIPATDRTTEELRLLTRELVPEAPGLIAWCEVADRVKFTDERPEREAARDALDAALKFVHGWHKIAAVTEAAPVLAPEGSP